MTDRRTLPGWKKEIKPDADLIQKIVDLSVKDNTALDISKELKISYPVIRRLMKTPEYVQAINVALRYKCSGFVDLVARTLERQLSEGNLKAVEQWCKIMGTTQEAPQAQQQNTGITVVMPNLSTNKETINVDSIVSERDKE